MQNITTVTGLKDAIKALETEQTEKGRLLKEQLVLTYESLKPINILRNTLKDLFTGSHIMEDISGTTFGMVIGYLIKKLFIRESSGKIRRILASVFQLGITKLIAQKAEYIRDVGQVIIQHLFSKTEHASQEQKEKD
jgi:hypothetical protein